MTFGFFSVRQEFGECVSVHIMFPSIWNDLICKKGKPCEMLKAFRYIVAVYKTFAYKEKPLLAEPNGSDRPLTFEGKTQNTLDTVKRACTQIRTHTHAQIVHVYTGHNVEFNTNMMNMPCLCAISKTMTVNIKTVPFSKDKCTRGGGD